MKKIFKIYPTQQGKGDRLDKDAWWKVVIHESKQAFDVHLKNPKFCSRKHCPKERIGIDGCFGVCHLHTFKTKLDIFNQVHIDGLKGELGEIHFIEREFDAETVTHECTHATIKTCMILTNVINFQLPSTSIIDFEEYIAYMTGGYVRQTLEHINKLYAK